MDGITKYNQFISVHKPQLVLSNVPEHYWPTLCKKLETEAFDAGLTFSLLRIEYGNYERQPQDPLWSVQVTRNVQCSDPSHIYLVDHAWTFRVEHMRNQLRNVPGLLDRMTNLMQIDAESEDEKIENVCKAIWKYTQTYAIAGNHFSVEDRVPLWYVMDELGSGIQHSNEPNFRAVPFIHVPEQVTYTILFPICDVEEGDTVTRNYVEGGFEDVKQRDAMLLPWQPFNYLLESFEQIEPDESYFLSGHLLETLPDTTRPVIRNVEKLKVFSEYSFINEYLTSDRFEITDNEDDADILWFLDHFKKFHELSENAPHKFINQFPFEYTITIKDLLAIISRRAKKQPDSLSNDLVTYPLWLPTTFNLKTELLKFILYYKRCEDAGLNNHWICKPFNLARSLDTYITDNLDFICRLPLTGPKIAQKYIEKPVLFERPDCGLVKFDVRYVILLKSVHPTCVYVYKNFFLRFANKPFALTNFDDYEQHFTVMNYNENATLFRMLCAEFKESWAKQYPSEPWDVVEGRILTMIRELFEAATAKDPPCGIGKNVQSRALYAADIMLSQEKRNGEFVNAPKLLEINWMPDCKRACQYYPEFYNDIFSVLFLDEERETCVQIL